MHNVIQIESLKKIIIQRVKNLKILFTNLVQNFIKQYTKSKSM